MMQGELPYGIDMVQFHGEDSEIIGSLLSVNHLFKRYVQLETFDLMLICRSVREDASLPLQRSQFSVTSFPPFLVQPGKTLMQPCTDNP